MNKTLIKVIKKNKQVVPVKTQNEAAKLTSDIELEMSNEVNNWISERRANSRTEKAFSDGKILEWEMMPQKVKITKTNKEVNAEISHHRRNVINLFEEGQTIHKAYLDAPDKQNLSDEIEQFTAKLKAGIDETDRIVEIQNQRSEENI